MNEKNKVFKKLLPIYDLYSLYQKLAYTIVTRIDLISIAFDFVAVDNSIKLLSEVGMIYFNQQKDCFEKTPLNILNYNDFSAIIYKRLKLSYTDAFLFFNHVDLKYEEVETSYYIKRNSVSLDLSGLLMLLDGLGKIEIKHNNIFILDKGLLRHRRSNEANNFYNCTLEELKKQLEKNEQYGYEAEIAAMKYEIDVLKNKGIEKHPERISEYSTSAGYDIVSFMYMESLIPDKFIEVKSCSDDRWIFYISKNELEVARNKGNSYYLYLFNRTSQQFRIIQNPYNHLLNYNETSKWAVEPQTYKVKLLEELD